MGKVSHKVTASTKDANNKPNIMTGEVFSPFVLKCLKKIDVKRRCSVIDIACGTGRHAHLMASNDYNVVAVDIAHDSLIKCKQAALSKKLTAAISGSIYVVRADATKVLPFKSSAFDVAIAIHFPYILQFEEIVRVLCKGGYVIYETIGRHGENWRDLPHLGDVRAAALTLGGSLLDYREYPAGPSEYCRGAVKMCARF